MRPITNPGDRRVAEYGADRNRLTRRGFLAVAAGASLGAVAPFRVPAGGQVSLPSSWQVLHDLLRRGGFGRISYAHIEYAPESPATLWGMLSLIAEGQQWPEPLRVYSFLPPASRNRSGEAFVGTVELPGARITVAARSLPDAARVSAASADLLVTPVAVDVIAEGKSDTRAAPWKSDYAFSPEPAAAAWAMGVCEALRASARQGFAVTRDLNTQAFVRAAARV